MTRSGDTLWTTGVVSVKYSDYQMEGYSLLTRGVSNPRQSGVFHSGLGVPVCVGNYRPESDFTRDRLDPL